MKKIWLRLVIVIINYLQLKKLTIDKLKLIAEQLSSMGMMQESQHQVAQVNYKPLYSLGE